MVLIEEKDGSDDPELARTEEPVGDYVLLGKLKIKHDEFRKFSTNISRCVTSNLYIILFPLLDECRLVNTYLEGLFTDVSRSKGYTDVSMAVSECTQGMTKIIWQMPNLK